MIPHVLRKVDGNFECICGAKVCKAVKVNTMPATGSLRVNGLDRKGSNLKTDINVHHQPSPGISNRRISVMSVQGQGMLTEPLFEDFSFYQKKPAKMKLTNIDSGSVLIVIISLGVGTAIEESSEISSEGQKPLMLKLDLLKDPLFLLFCAREFTTLLVIDSFYVFSIDLMAQKGQDHVVGLF